MTLLYAIIATVAIAATSIAAALEIRNAIEGYRPGLAVAILGMAFAVILANVIAFAALVGAI